MNKILNQLNKRKKSNKKSKLSKKQGIVVAEMILMVAVTLVVAISCFFPAFRNLVEQTITAVTNWYTTAIANLTV